ncbi:MAG: hypothetical protein HRT47_02610 [Candidatus Caenarcaniphilales bacterium]|nr:hypothetical protein [Candidatus Caenarcaniphilales bacterium]
MVDNIQLTSQQKLQQEKINAYIQSLENQLQPGTSNTISLDEALHTTLATAFEAFDVSGDGTFDNNEAQGIVDHLKTVNSDANIAAMFDEHGNLKMDVGAIVDVDNKGQADLQNDFIALDNVLSSKASVEYAESVMTGTGSKITLDDGSRISHGLGNEAVSFKTKGGYHIVTDTNRGGHQTKIFDSTGKMLTHVSGDPHVNEGSSTANSGWDWHFGDDSTFILDDGTEILFNTTGNASNNVYTTRGLYIISDDDVYQTGLDLDDSGPRNRELTKLDMTAVEFDATYADAKAEDDGADTFVYSKEANDGNGGWAVLTDEGTFEDIAYESWNDYRNHRANKQTFDGQTVDTREVFIGTNLRIAGTSRVDNSINLEQKEAALDGEAVRIYDRLEQNGATDEQKNDFFDYYFKDKVSDVILDTFTTLVEIGGTAEQFEALDEYKTTGTGVQLTDEQQANYLLLLVTNEPVAEMYLNLVQTEVNVENETNITFSENGIHGIAGQDSQDVRSHGVQYQTDSVMNIVDENTIELSGNAWKAVTIPNTYDVTDRTRVSFEISKNDLESEIVAIGFTDENYDGTAGSIAQKYQLDGKDDWSAASQNYRFEDIGDGNVKVIIELGDDFQGNIQELVLINDNDMGDQASSVTFSNVTVYDADPVDEALVDLFERAAIGDNPLDANQLTQLLEFADQDMTVANAYADLLLDGGNSVQEGAFVDFVNSNGINAGQSLNEFLELLDDAVQLTSNQAEKMVDYFGGGEGLFIAENYVELINDGANSDIENAFQYYLDQMDGQVLAGTLDQFTEILGEANNLTSEQTVNLVDYFIQSPDNAELYIDLINGGAFQEALDVFDRLATGDVNLPDEVKEELVNFLTKESISTENVSISDSYKNQLEILETIVGNENSKLIEDGLTILSGTNENLSLTGGFSNSSNIMNHVIEKYTDGENFEGIIDLLEYQNSVTDEGNSFISKNNQLINDLQDYEANQSNNEDLLTTESKDKINTILSALDQSPDNNLGKLSMYVRSRYQSLENGSSNEASHNYISELVGIDSFSLDDSEDLTTLFSASYELLLDIESQGYTVDEELKSYLRGALEDNNFDFETEIRRPDNNQEISYNTEPFTSQLLDSSDNYMRLMAMFIESQKRALENNYINNQEAFDMTTELLEEVSSTDPAANDLSNIYELAFNIIDLSKQNGSMINESFYEWLQENK